VSKARAPDAIRNVPIKTSPPRSRIESILAVVIATSTLNPSDIPFPVTAQTVPLSKRSVA
jgi:hypothetical protein